MAKKSLLDKMTDDLLSQPPSPDDGDAVIKMPRGLAPSPTPPPKPEPPTIVRMREDATAPPKPEPAPPAPITITVPQLTAQNQNYLDKAIRRFREILLDGQKKRADGRIVVEAHIISGTLNGKVSVGNRWDERI